MCPLNIYKASAGSGKTFQLTLAYLELLFKNPQSYRSILAVTFTNKAAKEMKSRILERLYELSVLKEGESSGDLEILTKICDLTEKQVKNRASALLTRILNDYSRFTVGTIDRFFQGVIRVFARDIGLPANFSLELDKDRVLSEAADRMFMDIGEDAALKDWLLKLAEARIESSQNWNFRSEIIALGEELFTEEYQSIMLKKENEISRQRLSELIEKIKDYREICIGEICKLGEESVEAMHAINLKETDFLGKGRSVAMVFLKAVKKEEFKLTVSQKEARFNESKWLSNKEDDQGKINLVQNIFMPKLKEIYKQQVILNSLNEVNRYIYALGILEDLSKRIREITDEKNLFLLSDASGFLRGIIGENPTPFVYEKTGNAIDHIMLDEFQDTSVFQWDNFRPLLEHALSIGKENIIVGDVKQSIYRWRNSDWKILAEKVVNAFPGFDIDSLSLQNNWRSTDNVINFNNLLFEIAPETVKMIISKEMDEAALDEEYRKHWIKLLEIAYSDVEQKIPEKSINSGGYVKGEVIEKDADFKDAALDKMIDWIKQLQDKRYASGEIAILVRTNKEGSLVAEKLMAQSEVNEKYNFTFISNDSLYVGNNASVRLIISLLTYILHPEDELNALELKYLLGLNKGKSPEEINEILHPDYKVEVIIGDDFLDHMIQFQRLPLFELTEKLIQLYNLGNSQDDLPYIQAFQGIVLELQQNNPGGVHDFLEYWKEFGIKKSVAVSEEQDSIQIITIHKAKGLQFRAVLIPFCDWELTTSAGGLQETIIWYNTEGTMFSEVPVVPLKYSGKLKESIFAQTYMEETIMGYVDNLNLLYVSLTRAEESMFIAMPEASGKSMKNAGELLMHSLSTSGNSFREKIAISDDAFELGMLETVEKRKRDVAEMNIDAYPVHFRNERIRLRMKGKEYLSGLGNKSHLHFGNVMHDIFSLVYSEDDVNRAVDVYVNEGILSRSDAATIIDFIHNRIGGEKVCDLFDSANEIINERDIFSDGKVYRPDRVIVRKGETIVMDYKFGELEERKYERQIGHYATLLERMGYDNVRAVLWYVMLDKLVEVEV